MIIIIRESFNDSVSEVRNVENVFELFKKCNINYGNMDNRVLRSVRREMTRDECRKCLRYLGKITIKITISFISNIIIRARCMYFIFA